MKLRRPRPRDHVYRAGSLLFFQGRGLVSRSIQIGTCSCLTHVAICATVTAEAIREENEQRALDGREPLVPNWPDWNDHPKGRLLLFESTTLCPQPCLLQGKSVSGVQCHDITARVSRHEGRVWAAHLREPLSMLESRLLTSGLLQDVGTRYDYRGALLSATLFLKHGIRAARAADRHTLFCCEIVVNRLQESFSGLRQYESLEPGTLAPRHVARWSQQLYHPLLPVGGRA